MSHATPQYHGRKIVEASAWKQASDAERAALGIAKFCSEDDVVPATRGSDGEPVERSLWWTDSTEQRDRHGDRIMQAGWTLKNFKANPVVPWGHNYHDLPVAKAIEVFVEDSKKARLRTLNQFATREMNPFADSVYQLALHGYLRAKSVGFVPLEWEIDPDDKSDAPEWAKGRLYTKCDLLESSVVVVPSNPGALRQARSVHGIDIAPFVPWVEPLLDEKKSIVGIPRSVLEQVRSICAPARTTIVTRGLAGEQPVLEPSGETSPADDPEASPADDPEASPADDPEASPPAPSPTITDDTPPAASVAEPNSPVTPPAAASSPPATSQEPEPSTSSSGGASSPSRESVTNTDASSASHVDQAIVAAWAELSARGIDPAAAVRAFGASTNAVAECLATAAKHFEATQMALAALKKFARAMTPANKSDEPPPSPAAAEQPPVAAGGDADEPVLIIVDDEPKTEPNVDNLYVHSLGEDRDAERTNTNADEVFAIDLEVLRGTVREALGIS